MSLISLPQEPFQAIYDLDLTRHTDDIAVVRFSNEMRAKMKLSREKGRYGWDDPTLCSSEYLAALLYSSVDRGDVVDIANFCMMLHQRGVTDLNDLPSLIDDCE